jgi:hypothetical protein
MTRAAALRYYHSHKGRFREYEKRWHAKHPSGITPEKVELAMKEASFITSGDMGIGKGRTSARLIETVRLTMTKTMYVYELDLFKLRIQFVDMSTCRQSFFDISKLGFQNLKEGLLEKYRFSRR